LTKIMVIIQNISPCLTLAQFILNLSSLAIGFNYDFSVNVIF